MEKKEIKKVVLNSRDMLIFELLGRFGGGMREDSLAIALDVSLHSVEILGARLMRGGYVIREKIMQGVPAYWRLDKSGAALAGVKKLAEIRLATLKHDDIVHRLAANIIKDGGQIVTEAELKYKFGSESKNYKLPDIVLVDKNIAIEVEISQKPDSALLKIIEKYKIENYSRILYISQSKAILNKIFELTNGDSRYAYKLFSDDVLQSIDYQPTEPKKLENPAQFKPQVIKKGLSDF